MKSTAESDWSPEDPVVQEVRHSRQRLWELAGGTIEGLMRFVAEQERLAAPPPRDSVKRRSRRSGANPRRRARR